jgi:anti-sigma factor RsiW
MSQSTVTEADLHAYVDGHLPSGRQAEIEAYLLAQPAQARRLESYRQQKAALRQCFDPVLEEPLPSHIAALVDRPSGAGQEQMRAWWPAWSLQRLAAGVLIGVLGAMAGWFGHGYHQVAVDVAGVQPLPRQAAVAHAVYSPDVRRPVEIPAEQEEQLVKWLSKRLGTPVRVPQLGSLGYGLVGGRLLPGNSGPVAQFMYQSGAGERMTLYVSTEYADQQDTAFRFVQEGQINVFYWVDGKFGYALSGRLDKRELAKMANMVYEQLEHR